MSEESQGFDRQIRDKNIEMASEREKCPNCEGENSRTGYIENWDGKCPDCGKKII